jgi:competence protein ComEC
VKVAEDASLFRLRLPFAGLLIAAIAGILFADNLSGTAIIAWIVLCCFILFLVLVHRPIPALGITFASFALIHGWEWTESPARRLAVWFDRHPGEYEVRGVVAQEPHRSPSGTLAFPLRIEFVTPPGEERPITTSPIRVMVRWSGEEVEYGDEITFHAVPSRPESPRNPGAMDYPGWLARDGIFTLFRIDPSVPGRIISHGHGNPLIACSIRARHAAERILAIDLEKPSEILGAIQGICLGVTENGPDGFTEEFRFTGTMHLFAVSGLHVGMVAVILWFFFQLIRLPRTWSVIATIPALFLYVSVTGSKTGSLRAATMASLFLLGLAFFRRSPPVNTLAAAAFLQLATDTNALFSAGWQFSYSVVLAILLLAVPIRSRITAWHSPDPFLPPRLLTRVERLRFAAWAELAVLVSVSIAAWVGSLLPTIAYFHLVSFSALGANLLAVPLAFGVLSLGMLALLTGGVFQWVAGTFNNANWLVAKLLLMIVQGSALLPGGHWFIGPSLNPYPVITFLDLRGASCALIRDGMSTTMIDAGRKRDAERTILPMLESAGVNRIGNLLVTRSDASHLGGIPALRRELRIGNLVLPDDPGRSPVAREIFASPWGSSFKEFGKQEALSSRVSIRPLLAEGDSVSLRISIGGVTVLWVPRSDDATLAHLEGLPPEELRADLVVIPLGGARMESVCALLRRIAPHAIISPVGGLGRNSIPSQEWNGVLRDLGITLFRLDQTGAVILNADPKDPKIRSWLPGGPELKLNPANREMPVPR